MDTQRDLLADSSLFIPVVATVPTDQPHWLRIATWAVHTAVSVGQMRP
jgi:hypothetical protein